MAPDLTPVLDVLTKDQVARLHGEPKIDIKKLGGLVALLHPASASLMTAVANAGDDEVHESQDLADLHREYITIAAMVASDADDSLVAIHLYAALRLGATPGQVANTLLLAGAYSGFQRYVRYLTTFRKTLFTLSSLFEAGVFEDLSTADQKAMMTLAAPLLANPLAEKGTTAS